MIAATMFSGIGAPEVSMPHWDWRWCAEIEKFPSAVLKKRFPHSVNLGDVNAPDFVERAKQIGRPDVIVFGSPCQDFSVAGQRVGLDGNRGNMALVALGIVAELRPRWVAFENVPGLLSSRSGSAEAERAVREGPVGGRADSDEDSDFAAFLSLFRECGYLGAYRITDAQFAGVPQRRRRIFLVGYLGDWRPATAVLFEPESLRGDHPPSREAGERTAPTISSRPTGSGGLGTDVDLNGGLIAGAVSSKWSKGTGGPAGDECYNLIADPIMSREGSNYSLAGNNPRPRNLVLDVVAFEPRDRGDDGRGYDRDPNFSENISPALNTVKPPSIAFDCKASGSQGFGVGDQAPTLRSMTGKHANAGGQIAVAFKPSHFTRGKDGAPDDTVPALSVEADRGDQDPVLMDGSAVRRLTPRECERLQGFPDDHTAIRYRGGDAADGPRYKALGNAMNVKEIGWILRRIEAFENR